MDHNIICSYCARSVPFADAWTTAVYGHAGTPLAQLPAYLHCEACKIELDATEAWMLAYQADPRNR